MIANRVGGEVHARLPLGAIVRDETLTLPERYLGLVTAAEGPLTPELRGRLAEAIERSVDLDALIAAVPLRDAGRRSVAVQWPRVRIAVARDTAFQFYYAENLEASFFSRLSSPTTTAAGAPRLVGCPEVRRPIPRSCGIMSPRLRGS